MKPAVLRTFEPPCQPHADRSPARGDDRSRGARTRSPRLESNVIRGTTRRTRHRVLLTLVLAVLAVATAGCGDSVADRLALLPVMATVPDGVEVVARERGSEIGGWPTTPIMAQVEYRAHDDRDLAPALDQIRRIAIDTGWDVEPSRFGDQVRATTTTADGPVRLSAFTPLDSDRIVMTVVLTS
jgi:transposase InsO family protein